MVNKNPISIHFRDSRIPRFADLYLIDENHNNKYTRLFHTHESELELYYAYSGKGYYVVDGRPYAIQKGDMVICNAGILHGDEPHKDSDLKSYCCALTNVAIEGLPDNWLTDGKSSPVVYCGALAEKIGNMMELIYMLSLDLDNLGEVCSSLATSLLLLVYQLVLSRARHTCRRPELQTDAIVEKIRNYLDHNYMKALTLDSIGEALRLSPYYVAHIFKDETTISPIQYMLLRRFGEAQSLLMNTELSMGEISDLLGFNSSAHFSSMFRKHVGLSPGQYRKSIIEMMSRETVLKND